MITVMQVSAKALLLSPPPRQNLFIHFKFKYISLFKYLKKRGFFIFQTDLSIFVMNVSVSFNTTCSFWRCKKLFLKNGQPHVSEFRCMCKIMKTKSQVDVWLLMQISRFLQYLQISRAENCVSLLKICGTKICCLSSLLLRSQSITDSSLRLRKEVITFVVSSYI